VNAIANPNKTLFLLMANTARNFSAEGFHLRSLIESFIFVSSQTSQQTRRSLFGHFRPVASGHFVRTTMLHLPAILSVSMDKSSALEQHQTRLEDFA
jgi:hypothetical protein